jgi:hypothetical protein
MTTEKRYGVTFYHDEEGEAGVAQMSLSYFPRTLKEAREAAKRDLSAYWQSASIRVGTWHAGIPGVRPSRFEADDNETPWLVGPDGTIEQ